MIFVDPVHFAEKTDPYTMVFCIIIAGTLVSRPEIKQLTDERTADSFWNKGGC